MSANSLSAPSDLREAVTRLRCAEVNAVSGVLKLYFRELPQPLVPPDLFQSLARTLGEQLMIKDTSETHWSKAFLNDNM